MSDQDIWWRKFVRSMSWGEIDLLDFKQKKPHTHTHSFVKCACVSIYFICWNSVDRILLIRLAFDIGSVRKSAAGFFTLFCFGMCASRKYKFYHNKLTMQIYNVYIICTHNASPLPPMSMAAFFRAQKKFFKPAEPSKVSWQWIRDLIFASATWQSTSTPCSMLALYVLHSAVMRKCLNIAVCKFHITFSDWLSTEPVLHSNHPEQNTRNAVVSGIPWPIFLSISDWERATEDAAFRIRLRTRECIWKAPKRN